MALPRMRVRSSQFPICDPRKPPLSRPAYTALRKPLSPRPVRRFDGAGVIAISGTSPAEVAIKTQKNTKTLFSVAKRRQKGAIYQGLIVEGVV